MDDFTRCQGLVLASLVQLVVSRVPSSTVMAAKFLSDTCATVTRSGVGRYARKVHQRADLSASEKQNSTGNTARRGTPRLRGLPSGQHLVMGESKHARDRFQQLPEACRFIFDSSPARCGAVFFRSIRSKSPAECVTCFRCSCFVSVFLSIPYSTSRRPVTLFAWGGEAEAPAHGLSSSVPAMIPP